MRPEVLGLTRNGRWGGASVGIDNTSDNTELLPILLAPVLGGIVGYAVGNAYGHAVLGSVIGVVALSVVGFLLIFATDSAH